MRNGRLTLGGCKGRSVRVTGEKVRCISVNYVNRELGVEDVYKAISEEWLQSQLSLYFMDWYSKFILGLPEEKRNQEARKILDEYLSASLRDLYVKMLLERKREALEKYRKYLRDYRAMLSRREVREYSYYINKDKLCKLISSLVMLHLVSSGALPSEVSIVVPYGYKSILDKYLDEELRSLGLPLIRPQVVKLTREEISRIRDVSSLPLGAKYVFILVTNDAMQRLAWAYREKLGGNVYVVRHVRR